MLVNVYVSHIFQVIGMYGVVSSQVHSASQIHSAFQVHSSKAARAVFAPGMLLAFSLCVAGPAFGQHPAFSCTTAHAPDEVTICNSYALSELDRQLNYVYNSALDRLNWSQQEVLRGTQRYWLRLRAECGYSAGCIGSLYRERIRQLNSRMQD
jgi:uncharacterized protein